MAGSFGFEREHYDISVALGNRRLAPAVKAAAADTEIVAPGISCRQQIQHLAGPPRQASGRSPARVALALVLASIAAVLLAALVKGAIGFGFPTLGTPLLALAVDVKTAVALLVIPNLVMDGLQLRRSGSIGDAPRRLAPAPGLHDDRHGHRHEAARRALGSDRHPAARRLHPELRAARSRPVLAAGALELGARARGAGRARGRHHGGHHQRARHRDRALLRRARAWRSGNSSARSPSRFSW